MLLWGAKDQLANDTAALISTRATEIHISAATIWEVEIKRAVGRLRAPEDLLERCDDAGFTRLPMTHEHAGAAGRLPLLHRDPFDRMLVAQAQLEGLTIVTADPDIMRYDVRSVAVAPPS